MPRLPRARRVLLVGLEVGLWAANAILAILLVVFVILGQGLGSGIIHRVLTAVSAGFLGRIEVGTARVFPDGTVIATDANIFDPEGRLVIHADRAVAHANLWSLFRRELELTTARATGVTADFAVDEAGDVNIARTFQPRHPGPSKPSSPSNGGGFGVTIAGIDVDLRRATLVLAPGPGPFAEVLGGRVQGHVEVSPRGDVSIDPELSRAILRGPLTGPLSVEGRMTLVGPELTASATVGVGDTSLGADAALDLNHLAGEFEVHNLVAGPATLARWLGPEHPRAMRASLSAELRNDWLRFDALRIQPVEGPGTIDASGALELATGEGEAHVSGQGVDARAFFGVLPRSDIGFRLRAAFDSVFTDRRTADAHLEMDRWSWDGEPVGPGAVDLSYAAKQLRFTHLDLAVPGARAIGQGTLSNRRVNAAVELTATNLAQLRTAIDSIARLHLPGFAGDATVKAHVEGTFDDLALNADVHSSSFSLNGLRAGGLVARVQAPHLGRRMSLQGHVKLGSLEVSDEVLKDLDLTVGWESPELSVRARATNRGQTLEVWTRGLLAANFARAEIQELVLTLPDGEWKLQLPAHFDFEDGVAFQDFRLASGDQRLTLSLSARSSELALNGEVVGLDLAKIPFLGLHGRTTTGVVTATVRYREARHHREAQAQVEVLGLDLDRLRVPSLRAIASLNDSQLSATLDATFGAGGARLRFTGPLPSRPGQLAGDLAISGLNPSDFVALFPELKPFNGHLSLDLGLSGDWAFPRVTLTASADQLQGPWITKPSTGIGPLSIEARFKTDERSSQLQATVIDDQQPTTNLVEVKGSIAIGSHQLGAFIRRPATARQFPDAAVQIAIETALVPLRAVGRVVTELSTVRGTGQLSADLHGSVKAIRGKLQLALRDFGFPHRHLGSIDLAAQAEDSGLTAHVQMSPPAELGGHMTVTASWGLRPEQIAHADARRDAPWRTDLQATDLPLALVLGRRSELQGTASVTADLRGSLGRPEFTSRVALATLKVSDKPAGNLDATADWDGHELAATLDGDQPSGGKIAAQARIPLGHGGLGAGPVTARLQAQAFDLSIFQPVLVQTKAVRALGGVLDADLQITGTRAEPHPKGTLALTQGELALAGLGELQHIQIQARVDSDSLFIEKLEAKSGGGPLTAKLSAKRVDAHTFALDGHLETDRFGIYVDDQLRALLTSKSDLSGKLTLPGPGADVKIAIRDASIHIPSLTQRDLAPTTLDPDIHISSWKAVTSEGASEGDDFRKPAETTPRPPIYLRLSAPGPIEVRGPDVRLDAKANLAVRLASDTELTGLVAVDHGEINALGRTFKVYRANIRFGDGNGDFAPPGSGRLDVQAGQEVDGYRVSLVVLGRIDHPVPQLTSDPPLPRAKIGQLLATGSNDADVGGQVSGGSVVSNLFVEGLKNWLKISPPLDVLTVDPNRLEAGKRLTSKLYVGVIDNYAVTDPRVNGTEVHARYDLGNHFALDGRYGTSQAGSFDLQWRHNW